jgi:phage major head subunit gpT-like protein
MTLDKQKLVDAEVGFRAIFEEQMLGQEDRPVDMMIQEYNTGNPREVLKWLERQNGVVEWTGDRIYDKARAFEKDIQVKKWSVGLEVEAEDIEDDRLSLYAPVIREMADDFVQHKWDLITTKLKAGFGGSEGLAYDGQFFFDSDHRDGPDGDVQINVGTAALSADAFDAARIAMRKIKKANNKTARVRPTHIVVGPDLEPVAENLFNLDRLANGADNRLNGAVQIVVSNELADQPNYWFLLDMSKVMKPFAMLSRRPVTFRSQDNLNDESAMDKDLYKYAADARYQIDYWGWKVAWGSDGTT